jgi:hypothetical protein
MRRDGRQADPEAVDDAERPTQEPVKLGVTNRGRLDREAASGSRMAHFETEWPGSDAALSDSRGATVDRAHERRPMDGTILDMESSVGPIFGGRPWRVGH